MLCCVGGPGSGKRQVCGQLAAQLPGWVHISVGQLLRDEVATRAGTDDTWVTLGHMMNNGQLVPDVS